ncbi:hypothetical protein H1R20_g1434, partial [Candolleomyces eurysporus]
MATQPLPPSYGTTGEPTVVTMPMPQPTFVEQPTVIVYTEQTPLTAAQRGGLYQDALYARCASGLHEPQTKMVTVDSKLRYVPSFVSPSDLYAYLWIVNVAVVYAEFVLTDDEPLPMSFHAFHSVFLASIPLCYLYINANSLQ